MKDPAGGVIVTSRVYSDSRYLRTHGPYIHYTCTYIVYIHVYIYVYTYFISLPIALKCGGSSAMVQQGGVVSVVDRVLWCSREVWYILLHT